MSNVTAREHSPITTEQVSRLIAKTLNWKAPGSDGISNFWIKRFTATHSYLTHYVNQFIEDAEKIPEFLVRGITYLLPKSQDTKDPSNYRPITCLCTIYKIYTACIAEKIYKHLETNKLLAEEKKGYIRNTSGTNTQGYPKSVHSVYRLL
jgi:hypothetical protein